MDIVRLRTMTWKSKFTEGRYSGYTVEEVFQLGRMKLVYIYYHYARISFADEILKAIGVKDDERIAKPGKNENIFKKKMRSAMFGVYGKKADMIASALERKRARKRAERIESAQNYSKAQLQWMNVKGRSKM